MKNRRPRKLKKLAKKRKEAADAFIMAQAGLVAALGSVQLATITSRPRPIDMPPHAALALKSLAVVQSTAHTAQAIGNVMKQIKPWREHASWK